MDDVNESLVIHHPHVIQTTNQKIIINHHRFFTHPTDVHRPGEPSEMLQFFASSVEAPKAAAIEPIEEKVGEPGKTGGKNPGFSNGKNYSFHSRAC